MEFIKGLHHVSMSVLPEEYEKVIAFYTEFLGLEYAHQSLGNTLLSFGNAVLEIFPDGDGSAQAGPVAHFAIATDEPDALMEKVRNAGYEVTDELIDFAPPMKDGEYYPLRFGFFRGPAGERVEIFCEKPVEK
ncbi:MAG: VOC family protein [Mogibacterium sp.]|nr:VOC family protein [Mogibacterium sp.]